MKVKLKNNFHFDLGVSKDDVIEVSKSIPDGYIGIFTPNPQTPKRTITVRVKKNNCTVL